VPYRDAAAAHDRSPAVDSNRALPAGDSHGLQLLQFAQSGATSATPLMKKLFEVLVVADGFGGAQPVTDFWLGERRQLNQPFARGISFKIASKPLSPPLARGAEVSRKPMWEVPVSGLWASRAAGR